MPRKKIPREVAVIDFETDPFKYDRVPAPFACGVLWRDEYREFWGFDCGAQAFEYLQTIDAKLVIYAHNGGKFDFYFLWPYLDNPMKIINGRIVACKFGKHELRDSYAILPFPLREFEKTAIDYAKFEPEVREKHRVEILAYLHDDCTGLKKLVDAFVERFGFALTIAGVAMKQLQKLHPQEFQGQSHDARMRKFYFGGRVSCFDSGVLVGNWKVYDVNSMYPSVMRDFDHPMGKHYRVLLSNITLDADNWIAGYPGEMYFCEVSGINFGALPIRDDENAFEGLNFNVEVGTFTTTSHELRAAIELGKFEVVEIHSAMLPRKTQRFAEFVDTYAAEKALAKKTKDKTSEIFAKLILNSAYGKFGQNPDKFKEWRFEQRNERGGCSNISELMQSGWQLEQGAKEWTVWSKPAVAFQYFDVAIAASVTSAARSVLLRAVAKSTRPIYCDTDSIICEKLAGVEIHASRLGAWKLEAIGDRVAIAGKKLYALFRDAWTDKAAVKWASKGTRLAPSEIVKIARGGEVTWESDAPNFSLSGKVKFTKRKSRRTV